MIDIGYVSKVIGSEAYVTLAEKEDCLECGARIICKSNSNGARELKVDNSIGAKVGHEVEIREPEAALLKISFLQYGLPFIGFVAGLFIAYGFGWSVAGVADELVMFFWGTLGLAVAGITAWLWARQLAVDVSLKFSISRILS